MNPLPRAFYQRSTPLVAQELLGKVFISTVTGIPFMGRIVETEAYQSDDPACHAYKGRTNRNTSLFGPVGHTYVYLCYGIHWCMNIVSHDEQVPAGGVLIRGIEKIDVNFVSLERFNGPGRSAKVLSITDEHAGVDVTSPLSVLCVYDSAPIIDIEITPRIGISRGTHKLWRFVIPQGRSTNP